MNDDAVCSPHYALRYTPVPGTWKIPRAARHFQYHWSVRYIHDTPQRCVHGGREGGGGASLTVTNTVSCVNKSSRASKNQEARV